ncbi:MAG TPA: ATP-dependent metalloprotease, partial [Xanthomonadaceae bacterium]|nr:ATP-dependent metalloprotease [Xanthomonadaceae bacterium]
EDEVFLGRSVTQHNNVSDETARKIDEVVRGILDRAYQRSRELLTANIDKLRVMAETLLIYETIDVLQIDAIMEGRPPPPPLDWTKDGKPLPTDNSAGTRPKPLGGPAPTV